MGQIAHSMRRLLLVCGGVLSLFSCRPETVPERIELSPDTLSLQFGESQTASARVLKGTKELGLEGLTWTSSDPSLVSVTETEPGVVTLHALNSGTVAVTASVRQASASLSVTVAPRVIVLERIEVTAPELTLPRGLRQQLTATGFYNDGSRRDLTSSVAWASGNSARATVSSTGLSSAVGLGEVELRALKDGIVGRLSITVTMATLVGLDVRPSQATLANGTTQQFSATARFSDATTRVVTSQVTWTTSDASIATADAAGRLTATGVGDGTLTAAMGEVSGTAEVTVTTALLLRMELTPAAASLPLGSTQQLEVTGHFSDGTLQSLTSQASWRSGTPAVASVTTSGLVTSAGLGLSVITATIDSISASASVTCTAAQLSTIAVAPQGLMLARGLRREFTATGIYTDATTRDLTQTLVWSSSDGGVATVGNTGTEIGKVNAVAEGTATISATNGALTGTALLNVVPALLVSLQVSPLTVSVPAGLTRQLTAQGTFSDGSTRDVTASVTWASDAQSFAMVSNALGSQGLLTALAQGTSNVTATAGAASAALVVTVTPPVLQRLDVTAPSASLAVGRTQQLTATGVYSDGSTQNLTSTATWTPSTGPVLRVSSAGVMTAVGVGTTNATATVGLVSGSSSLSVTPAVLDAITIAPVNPSLGLGQSVTLVATGRWSDNTTTTLTGVTWTSETPAVATIDANGLVASVTEGTSLVTAAVGAIVDTTRVTVTPPVLTSITLTPANPALEKSQTVQLGAQGLYSDGSTAPVTSQVTWSSSTAAVATVSSTGEVWAMTPGTTTVSASLQGVTGTTTISVNRPALSSLDVSPVTATVGAGATVSFVATATYVDASTEVVTALVTWSSSDVNVATISASGVARGVAVGTVTITASWGAFSNTAQLTVSAPTVQSIVVSGRSKVAVGSAVQLVAMGTFVDGGTADVTGQATWGSDVPATASFTNVDGVRGVLQGAAVGTVAVTASVGAVTSAAFSAQVLAINAPYSGRCGPGLVISQVYGGGGNAGATWRNDFVELHNPTSSGLSLNGLSLQYGAAANTNWSALALSNVTVPAGGYYLVQLASGGTAGAVLPAVDQASGVINLSATTGKVALINGTAAVSGACGMNVIDFVGFGSANCVEGAAAAPAPSATTWLTRGVSGCRDGNQNGTDFTAGTVAPRPSGTAPLLCSCSANGTGLTEELSSCVLQSAANLSVAAGAVSPAVAAEVTQPGVTDSAGFNASLQVQVGHGPNGVNPTTSSGWLWWPTVARTAGTTSDTYDGVFVGPASATYGFTARASADGVNWTACDLNGAGRGAGLAFEMGQLGVLTVP